MTGIRRKIASSNSQQLYIFTTTAKVGLQTWNDHTDIDLRTKEFLLTLETYISM